MWGRQSKTRQVIDYAEHVAADEQIREHTREAVAAGERARRRLFPDRRAVAVATRAAQDEQIRDQIVKAVEQLREAQQRLRGKKSHRGRNLLLLATAAVAALFNPVTGAKTRGWLGGIVGRLRGGAQGGGGMPQMPMRGATSTVEETIEVAVPVSTAYNQWTQFEEFPSFMDGVESVRQLDDTHVHWVAQIGGKRHEWDAEITEQRPDQRVAWRATDGKANEGEVTFEPVDGGRTRVSLRLSYEAEGLAETLGSAVGVDSRRVKADLQRFKELIESRGQESGAWRGEVVEGQTQGQA